MKYEYEATITVDVPNKATADSIIRAFAGLQMEVRGASTAYPMTITLKEAT